MARRGVAGMAFTRFRKLVAWILAIVGLVLLIAGAYTIALLLGVL